jgi:hypothetical protein
MTPVSDDLNHAGGWWAQPSNWRSNTAVAMGGILAITYAVFNFSADREVRALALHIFLF